MKLTKRLTALLASAAMALAAVPAIPAGDVKAANAATPQQLLDKMGIGWNLGNSFDVQASGDYSETMWGNPKTTKEMIEFVHDQGFSSIRIPVTWGYHMDSSHKISASFMARVKEVVDYAYNDGMYVIINIHHDNDIRYDSTNFFFPSSTYKAQSETFVKSVWTQVSEAFKDYDEHLVFETLNEPRLIGSSVEWWFDYNNPPSEAAQAIDIINTLNQDAVDVIRASGGNNKTRLIMCPGYAASRIGIYAPSFKLPNDSSKMVGVSVHAYEPYDFAMNGDTQYSYDSNMQKTLADIFSELTQFLSKKGYAAYIGEFGATIKNNDAERCKWAEDYTAKAKAAGIPVFLWDNNAFSTGWENYGLIDRANLTVKSPAYFESLMKAYPKSSARLPGDANESGTVDIRDVMLIQQSIAGWNVTVKKENCDVNGDGLINIKDVMLIQQSIAGWKVTLK